MQGTLLLIQSYNLKLQIDDALGLPSLCLCVLPMQCPARFGTARVFL